MDRNDIEKHDLARRYLLGELSPEESIAFEEYILDKPELIEELELDRVMYTHLPDTLMPAKKGNVRGWRAAYSNLIAVAACVALIAVLLVPSKSDIESISIVDVGPVRSNSEYGQTLKLDLSVSHTIWVLSADYADVGKEHAVEVTKGDTTILSTIVKADDVGAVNLLLKTANLPIGEVTVSLYPINNDQRVAQYRLNIVN